MESVKIKDGFKGERSLILPEGVCNMQKSDYVLQTLYITDIGFYPHAVHHYRKREVPIDQYVLIYCIKGSGCYEVAGNEHEVKENQYFILPAGLPHAYYSNNDDPWTIYWIHFAGTQAKYYAEGIIEPVTVSAGINSRTADRNNIFEDIFLTLSDGLTVDNLRYTSSLLHFYLGSLRYLPIYRRCHKRSEGELNEEYTVVNAAMRYMEENIEKSVTLQELSNYTGYSVSHFSAIFKAKTGHSPLSYFNLLKIKKACELLETTDMKINQVCCMVGIDDSYYFSRLFSKIVGIPPREYRKRNPSAITDDRHGM